MLNASPAPLSPSVGASCYFFPPEALGESGPPLALLPLNDPPQGQLRLTAPVRMPDGDDDSTKYFLAWQIAERQHLARLLAANDPVARRRQALRFASLVFRAYRQMYGRDDLAHRLENFSQLASLELLDQIKVRSKRETGLVMVRGVDGFRVIGRNTRTSAGILLPLDVVLEALSEFGLWPAEDDASALPIAELTRLGVTAGRSEAQLRALWDQAQILADALLAAFEARERTNREMHRPRSLRMNGRES